MISLVREARGWDNLLNMQHNDGRPYSHCPREVDWLDLLCASLTGDRLRGRGICPGVVGIVHTDQRRHASESLRRKWQDAEVPNVEDVLLFVHL